MNQTTVINKINDLNYKGLKEAYIRQIEDTTYHQLSFEERLYNLLEAQELSIHNKRIATNLRASKIKDKQAAVEDIEYSATRVINRELLQALITMDFIRQHQNIIITGKTGTGKSYIAQALANRAILDGFRVFYIRVPTLLILDDFGVSQMSVDDSTNLFEIIEDRTEVNSLIITSQLPVSQWYEYLNNGTVADAILDRVVHSSHRIELEGESMRKLRSNISYN